MDSESKEVSQNLQLAQAVRMGSSPARDGGRKEDWFTIGEMGREFGLTLRALRFYEDRGLIHPKREGASRLYSKSDREKLALLLLCKRVGMSIIEIGEMLALDEQGRHEDHGDKHRMIMRERFSRQLTLLADRKNELEKAVDDLRSHLANLDVKASGGRL